MKKINKALYDNVLKIITIFLLMQPILDLGTALSIKYNADFLSFGMIFRFIFMMIIVYYTVFLSKAKCKKISIVYLLVALAYIAIFIVVSLDIKGLSLIFTEIKWIIKNFYFPVLLVGFINIFSDKTRKISSSTFVSILSFYVFIIIACQAFGVESQAYTQGKTGYIGLFYSANEISAIISILMPFLFFYKFDHKRVFVKLAVLLATLYCCLIIGTKTSFLSLGIVSIAFLIDYSVKLAKSKKYELIKIIVLSAIGTVAIISIVLPYTSFGKNIIKHVTFLEIDNIGEIFESDNFNRLIFSDRLTFLEGTKSIYEEAEVSQKIVGIGYSFVEDQKLIEIDYYDIFYRYGPLGFIVYFIPLVIIIMGVIRQSIKKTHKTQLTYKLAIFLGLMLAFFTGHVFTAPSVSIYLSLIITLLYTELDTSITKTTKEVAL